MALSILPHLLLLVRLFAAINANLEGEDLLFMFVNKESVFLIYFSEISVFVDKLC